MEGRGHRQRQGALDALGLGDFARARQSVERAGNHHLARGIVIGDDADAAGGGGFFRHLFGLFDVGADQRGHAALAHRHRRLHRLAASLEQPRGIGQGKAPAAQSAEYSPRL